MVTITCKLPAPLGLRLEAQARRERVPKSAIVRQAIEERLRRAGRTAEPSAFDLVRSLCGSLRGPRDLSADPRHLEDLGA